MNLASLHRGLVGPEPSAEHLASPDRLERITNVFDPRRVVVFRPDNGHDVEPAALLEQAMFFQEMQGCQGQPTLLFQSDGFCWHTLSPGLDFNENDDVAIECNQIDFAVVGPVAAVQNSQAMASKKASGLLLAPGTEQAVPERLNNRVLHWMTSDVA